MNLTATKLELIKLIADVQSESLLEQVKQFFKQKEKEMAAAATSPDPKHKGEKETPKKNGKDSDALRQMAAQPTPAFLDLAQLKKEQGYDSARLGEILKNWDYRMFEDQPLEELLNSLTP